MHVKWTDNFNKDIAIVIFSKMILISNEVLNFVLMHIYYDWLLCFKIVCTYLLLFIVCRCDYGCIARGQLSYMSPELMSSLQIDPPNIYAAKPCTQASDIYAFG